MKKLNIKGTIRNPAKQVANAAYARVRLIIGLDKQCNGTVAAPDDVLDVTQPLPFHAFRNTTNSGRFVILKDKIFTMNPTGGNFDVTDPLTGFTSESIAFNWNFNIDKVFEWQGATGQLIEIKSNNLFMLAVSENQIAGAPATQVILNVHSRVRYTDS